MHSKIFQLSDEPINVPMNESDFLSTDCDYTGGGFVGTVADYVSQLSESAQKECWLDFIDSFKDGLSYNAEDNSITIIDKNKLFKESFSEFSKLITGISIKEFVKSSWAYKVTDTIAPQFSWYVYSDLCWQPYTSFFRDVTKGEKYYCGSVLDYHC